MQRHGPLYAAAVLRPLAEQLADHLRLPRGASVCDMVCDGGVLTHALALSVGAGGLVLAVDEAAYLPEMARTHDAGTARVVPVHAADVTRIADASCDAVAGLLTWGFAPNLQAEARRVSRAVPRWVVWDPGEPPPHEAVLRDALRAAGLPEDWLDPVLAAPARGAVEAVLHDVVRFDGIGQYWAALVTERPLAAPVRGASDDVLGDVRERCARALAPFTAADDTLRIPVRALVLSA